MCKVPVVGLACVIDRPGYNARYFEQYNQNPWQLCKTAFSIIVERAAKFTRSHGCRLRIAPERCNQVEDRQLKIYYESLRAEGMPFSSVNSAGYRQLSASDFQETLYEFRLKAKTSPMVQFADLYLWPICMGGYHAGNRSFRRLLEDGKLIECGLDPKDWPQLATKYSCFENVLRKS